MANYSDFNSNNSKYVAGFSKGDLPMPPARKAAALVCMDARLLPERFFGLQEGDIHVIRNAGGRVTADAIRSLTISQQLLGTREIFVVHHTDCGMETFENADLAKILKDAFGVDASGQDFLPFKGVDKSVADDVELLQRSDTILKGTPIIGLVYDLKEVVNTTKN